MCPRPTAQLEARAPKAARTDLPLPRSCPSLSLRLRQTTAWKAGHKRECGAPGLGAGVAQIQRPAREAARPTAGLTAQQVQLGMRLSELAAALDWLGVLPARARGAGAGAGNT